MQDRKYVIFLANHDFFDHGLTNIVHIFIYIYIILLFYYLKKNYVKKSNQSWIFGLMV
jgi:hypothetical protein